MKKIINGKVYDTGTAEIVGEWDNGHYMSDFDYCSENLYRKKTGEFFLHGEGGALSKYAESRGDGWGGGEKIMPLSYQAAQEWAEAHLSGDEYESIFGAVDENEDGRKNYTFYLPVAAVEKAKRVAAQSGIGLSAYIESLL